MGLMIGTFIGPGGIYMAIAGGMNQVFGIDALVSLGINIVPLILYSLACYYTPSKFQLALAKILTLGYTMLMLAVYVGLVVQIADKGLLSATSVSALSFFGPLVIAGMLHFEEAYCMLYMGVYLVTIPSMYVLLVIYSFFNLWNVSWGTREVAQKKSAAELKREKEEMEKRQAELKKKKKDGLLGTLLDQFNLGGDKGDTASVDFSFGNVLRCMCFSYEDPLEPKKQLVKIAATLDDVSKRLNKMEAVTHTSGSVSGLRRKSSYRGNQPRKSSSLPGVQEGTEPEQQQDLEVELKLNDQYYDDSESSSETETEVDKEERNDEVNPFWIDDDNLKKGPKDFLTQPEVKFWKDLIQKYLLPLQMTQEQKDKQAAELKDYRDIIIFTFLMVNALYIVMVTMLQTQAELTIPWVMFAWTDNVSGISGRREDGIVYNISYIKPESSDIKPEIRIGRTTDTLDMLGLFFLLTFSSITAAQMIGMIMHRWQTCRMPKKFFRVVFDNNILILSVPLHCIN